MDAPDPRQDSSRASVGEHPTVLGLQIMARKLFRWGFHRFVVPLQAHYGRGLYGLGAMITFCILNVQELWDDWLEAESAWSFLLYEWVFDLGFGAIGNGIAAMFWPFLWWGWLTG